MNGYAYANLYRCSWGAYTVVIAAATPKAARLVFEKWLGEHHHVTMGDGWRIKRAKTLGGAPLLVGA